MDSFELVWNGQEISFSFSFFFFLFFFFPNSFSTHLRLYEVRVNLASSLNCLTLRTHVFQEFKNVVLLQSIKATDILSGIFLSLPLFVSTLERDGAMLALNWKGFLCFLFCFWFCFTWTIILCLVNVLDSYTNVWWFLVPLSVITVLHRLRWWVCFNNGKLSQNFW